MSAEQPDGQPGTSQDSESKTQTKTIRVTGISTDVLMEIPENATGADIRAAIAQLITINARGSDKPFDDSKTLGELSLTGPNPAVDVTYSAYIPASTDTPYPINIMHHLTGEQYQVTVTKATMVEDLSEMIHKLKGIPVDQQLLAHAGNSMQVGHALSIYKVGKNSIVTVILRYSSGPSHPSPPHLLLRPPRPLSS